MLIVDYVGLARHGTFEILPRWRLLNLWPNYTGP